MVVGMCIFMSAEDKLFRAVCADLFLLFLGAGCFLFSFADFLGYACLVPLLLGCFLMCLAAFDVINQIPK